MKCECLEGASMGVLSQRRNKDAIFFTIRRNIVAETFKLLPARTAAPCRVPALSRNGGKYASTREDIKNQQHFWIHIFIHTTRESVIIVFV